MRQQRGQQQELVQLRERERRQVREQLLEQALLLFYRKQPRQRQR